MNNKELLEAVENSFGNRIKWDEDHWCIERKYNIYASEISLMMEYMQAIGVVRFHLDKIEDGN